MSIRDKMSTMLACLCEEGMITAYHGQRFSMKAGYRRCLSSNKTCYRLLFSLRAGSGVWVCLETIRRRNRTSDLRIPFPDAVPLSLEKT